MTQLELAQKAELEKLQAQNELMRKLATKSGFYHFYFTKINDFKTNIECFNYCNELYHSLFGEYRYSSNESFKNNNAQKFKK